GRDQLVPHLLLHRAVAIAADQDLPAGELAPVSIAVVGVGGAIGDPGREGRRGQHLSPDRRDRDPGQELAGERVGGEDDLVRGDRQVLEAGGGRLLEDGGGRAVGGQGADRGRR